MNTSIPFDAEQKTTVFTLIIDHPYILAAVLFTLCCIITRIVTGLQVDYKGQDVGNGKPREIPVVPYWLPLIGHTFQFIFGFQNWVKALAPQIPSALFTLRIGGENHSFITAPSVVKEIYNKASLPLTMELSVVWFLDTAFGGRGAWKAWNNEDHDAMWSTDKLVHNLMKEPFLSNAIKSTVTAVEDRTWNLVSGLPSWVDHATWERSAQVEIVSSDPKDGSFVAEADLFGLTRNFVGDIATSLLMGKAFLENNPTFLEDLWLFDSKITTLAFGLPSWLTPHAGSAIRARERVIEAVREHHRAMIDLIEGKDPGYKYSEMNDVSNLIWDRVRLFYKLKVTDRIYGSGDLTLLWAMNVNANVVVFWLLFYLYSDAELLERVRAEIKPFVRLRQSESSGLPIKEAPRLDMDIVGLYQKCPLFKGAFVETMRLQVAVISYRYAADEFVLSESKEDALKAGKMQPAKYNVKKGDVLAVPMIVHQTDPAYFKNPSKFDPRRFWVEETDENGQKQTRVDYGTVRPWGGGKQMCKGRNFAEREVLAIVAGIIMLWEISPVSKSGWKHPGNKDTVGTYLPEHDIRVKMWRRET